MGDFLIILSFILGANINNSLMVLGQVISKLSEGNKGHVPFRNSQLTRILKNSLGGNTKTAIICTVTPAEEVQTKSTLDFAARAKTIVQHAHVNEILDEKAQMNRLRKEIADLKKLHGGSDLNSELLSEKEKNAALQKQIEELNSKLLSSKNVLLQTAPSVFAENSKLNARRMTFAGAPLNAGNRRVSFGGALRLQKFKTDKPDFSLGSFKHDKPEFSPGFNKVKNLVHQFNISVSFFIKVVTYFLML